jgi:hypothetical protein
MVVHTCNHSTRQAEAEGFQVEGQLVYIMRPWFGKKKKKSERKKREKSLKKIIRETSPEYEVFLE